MQAHLTAYLSCRRSAGRFGRLAGARSGGRELRSLATHLRCVIVVSHQPAFMDRTMFAHGYVLTRRDGGTEIMKYV